MKVKLVIISAEEINRTYQADLWCAKWQPHPASKVIEEGYFCDKCGMPRLKVNPNTCAASPESDRGIRY